MPSQRRSKKECRVVNLVSELFSNLRLCSSAQNLKPQTLSPLSIHYSPFTTHHYTPLTFTTDSALKAPFFSGLLTPATCW